MKTDLLFLPVNICWYLKMSSQGGYPPYPKRDCSNISKKRLHKIIPQFGSSLVLESDNNQTFTAKVSQNLIKAFNLN